MKRKFILLDASNKQLISIIKNFKFKSEVVVLTIFEKKKEI